MARLDPDGKARVFDHLYDERVGTAASIRHTPGVCGGRACLGATRFTVWGLEAYRRLGVSEQELLEQFPSLGPEDLRLAFAYADEHPEEIERDIRENEDF